MFRRRPRPGHRTVLIVAFLILPGFTAVLRVDAQVLSSRVAVQDDSSAGPVLLREIVTGLDHPWAVAPLPEGDFLVTERSGDLLLVQPGRGTVLPVAGSPRVFPQGQGGLLDVVLSPTFSRDRLVYLSYAEPSGSAGAVTAVGRGRLESAGARPSLTGWEVIFRSNAPLGGGQHFGSRLLFDREGYLYITLGERGRAELAQDPALHPGSVVRIHPDGSLPRDNPSVSGYAPGLFTWGHRNAQGIALHPGSGAVWLHEHGPRGGDEINVLTPGGNFGWPRVTLGTAYSGREIAEAETLPGLLDPILHWTPSIAPSGMAFVPARVVPGRAPGFASWEGDLLVGALAGRHLRRITIGPDGTPGREEQLFSGFARIRDVRAAPDGSIYLVTDEDRGGLYRLESVADRITP